MARDLRTHPHAHALTYANALVDVGAGCICVACVWVAGRFGSPL